MVNRYFKKYYKYVGEHDLYVCEGTPTVYISPGNIVKIQTEGTINGYPMLFVKDDFFDIAMDNTDFENDFEEFNIRELEEGMTKSEFQKIFECTDLDMERYFGLMLDGFYESYYDLAVNRMVDEVLGRECHYISESAKMGTKDILDYILIVLSYGEDYTMRKWLEESLVNYPELFDDNDKKQEMEAEAEKDLEVKKSITVVFETDPSYHSNDDMYVFRRYDIEHVLEIRNGTFGVIYKELKEIYGDKVEICNGFTERDFDTEQKVTVAKIKVFKLKCIIFPMCRVFFNK